jgi:hypothetical protein
MATNDLERQNELADALLEKLGRIKELWAEMPTVDDLEEASKAAGGVAESLAEARETYQSDEFPTVDDLNEMSSAAGHIAERLEEAQTAADGLPTE